MEHEPCDGCGNLQCTCGIVCTPQIDHNIVNSIFAWARLLAHAPVRVEVFYDGRLRCEVYRMRARGLADLHPLYETELPS